MRYLVDTNVISEIMRKNPEPVVVRWFSNLDQINISVVTLDEILFGLASKKLVHKAAWFRQFCAARGEILPVDEAIARQSGEKRATLSRHGITMTMADSLIAATARESGLVLATRNTKDFQKSDIALFNPWMG